LKGEKRVKLNSLVRSETFVMALDNVRAHKFRSFLTVLGIVIGVTTVIAIASILTGLRTNIIQFVEEYGTNNIYAFHLSTGISLGAHDRSERTRKPLRPEDGEAIRQFAPAVEDVANDGFIEWNFDKTLTYGGQTYKQGNLEGVSANYAAITNELMAEGRFISELDDQHRREVMVIGNGAADALFPGGAQAVGKEVMMGGKPYEIVGVLEKRKGSLLEKTRVTIL
jgi:putative ABC transport system permease protein